MPDLSDRFSKVRSAGFFGFSASVLLVSLATAVCELLLPYLLPINLLMIYLLIVVFTALKLGFKPAIVATVLGCFSYNYLYVAPRYVINFLDKEYLSTFFGFFITGAVISSLVSKLRDRAESLQIREAETASLYQLSRELAVSADISSILRAVVCNVEVSLNSHVALYLENNEQLELVASSKGLTLDQQEIETLALVFQAGRSTASDNELYKTARLVYFPLTALKKSLGIMAINVAESSVFTSEQMYRLVEAFAAQIAMALERVNLTYQAEQAHILHARQKLERALLNSVSHDLRTPLATITGVLTTVLEKGDLLNDQVREELLENAKGEAARLNRFVGNLLDITRLEARATVLKLEPCDVQDLIGCALAAIDSQLKGRSVAIKLTADLPLVPMDMVLMNQVLINLLDNALKYAPPEGTVSLSAICNDGSLLLQVSDSGPGVPDDELKRIFEKFYRIPVPESVKGTGLGLSICHGIVEAHGGEIWAENQAGEGFTVTLKIPLMLPSREQDNDHGH